jgi:hypothetical protein
VLRPPVKRVVYFFESEEIMGRLEVQGIVSVKTGEPLVQFRQLDDNGALLVGWQTGVLEAREMAQQVQEAATNAVYDAAMVAWAKEVFPDEWEETVGGLLPIIRKYRADAWGLPDQPEDWR